MKLEEAIEIVKADIAYRRSPISEYNEEKEAEAEEMLVNKILGMLKGEDL